MRLKILPFLCLAAALLAIPRETRAQASSDYRIAPNDIITIDVLGERDLAKELRVSGTGTINYFLLGTIEVGGKTTEEVKDILTELLDRDYLVNPQVTVDVKEYRVREVLVGGAVAKPGAVVFSGEQELTIVAAIGRAGGLTQRANTRDIKFTRPGRAPVSFRWEDLNRQTHAEMIKLQPGDVIEVGDRLF